MIWPKLYAWITQFLLWEVPHCFFPTFLLRSFILIVFYLCTSLLDLYSGEFWSTMHEFNALSTSYSGFRRVWMSDESACRKSPLMFLKSLAHTLWATPSFSSLVIPYSWKIFNPTWVKQLMTVDLDKLSQHDAFPSVQLKIFLCNVQHFCRPNHSRKGFFFGRKRKMLSQPIWQNKINSSLERTNGYQQLQPQTVGKVLCWDTLTKFIKSVVIETVSATAYESTYNHSHTYRTKTAHAWEWILIVAITKISQK